MLIHLDRNDFRSQKPKNLNVRKQYYFQSSNNPNLLPKVRKNLSIIHAFKFSEFLMIVTRYFGYGLNLLPESKLRYYYLSIYRIRRRQ
jgi:hypothetical protein